MSSIILEYFRWLINTVLQNMNLVNTIQLVVEYFYIGSNLAWHIAMTFVEGMYTGTKQKWSKLRLKNNEKTQWNAFIHK